MNRTFLVYAVFVTVLSTVGSWGRLFRSIGNGEAGAGSSWTSTTGGGGGSYGGGAGGGGHK